MSIDLSTLPFLVFIALGVGFVKAGLPALGMLTTILLLFAYPARDAIGLALLYLIAGDIAAMCVHHRNADYRKMFMMLPAIIIGIMLAGITLQYSNNSILSLLIGVSIIVLVIIGYFREQITPFAMKHMFWVRNSSGILAGFTTTIGNIAGPVISVYFLLLDLKKETFVATTALFFIIVNTIKLPLYFALDIFKVYYLSHYAVTVPLVFIGAFYGKRLVQWLPQKLFNNIILLLSGVAGLWLIIKQIISFN